MKTRKGEPVIVVPEEQQQIVELERQLAERDRRIGELETELRRWRGCPSCKEDHDDSVMCPPHEVRTSGRAWFHTQARKWAERAEQAEQRVKELEAECDNLRVMFNDSQIALHSASHRADEATSARRQAEKERDELQRKLDACQCETRVLNESMLIEARQERDQLAAECGLLREALIWASAADDFSPGGEGGFLPGKAREGFEKIVLPALASTPHAAKAAERVKTMENVVNEARTICNLMEALTREGNELAEVDFAAFAELCTAIDALDKPEVQERET